MQLIRVHFRQKPGKVPGWQLKKQMEKSGCCYQFKESVPVTVYIKQLSE